MAWRRPGDKPLSEPKMESFLTHICVTRPQWVKIDHWSLWLITAKRHVQRLWLPLFLTLQGLDKYHFWTTRKPVVLQTVYAVPIWIHVFVWGHLAYEWKSKYKMRTLIIAFNEKTHSLICAYIYMYVCICTYICICVYMYMCIYMHMQCGAIMTRSVFFTIHIIHTPQLTREGEVWDVCFELEVWVTFCCYHYSTVSNIAINRTALWRRSAVCASMC